MLNVPELERRWKRHRRRKYIPLYTAISISLIIAFLVILSYLIQNSTRTETVQYSSQKSSIQVIAVNDNNKSIKSLISVPDPNITATQGSQIIANTQSSSSLKAEQEPIPSVIPKLTPSMAFMKDVENEVLDYYFQNTASSTPAKEPKTTVQLPSIQTYSNSPSPIVDLKASAKTSSEPPRANDIKPKNQTTKQQKPSDRTMHIQRENDIKDIQDVISRFKKNKNPALSLFVAKRYYRIGNYQQAYNYALITNELDNNIEDSWLIFAKSLYKLGQTKMAIKTLKTYQRDSGSVKAKITLDQMTEGTFE